MIKPRVLVIGAAAALSVFAGASRAAVIYSAANSTYSQNFDTLPTTPENTSLGNSTIGWQNDTATPGANNFSLVGWYLFHPASLTEGGFDGHQRMRIGAGSANTGAFMSFGASGSTDRAMGSLVSGTTVPTSPGQQYIALRLTNTTGQELNTFTLSYDGEQWRDGGATTPAAKTLQVQYSTTATTINDSAAFTNAPSTLNFTTPVFTNTGSGAAVNGNTTGKTSIAAVTIENVHWAPNTDLWIRWLDPRSSGNNHGVAIDNVNFSADVPEPAAAALSAAMLLATLRRRNRQSCSA